MDNASTKNTGNRPWVAYVIVSVISLLMVADCFSDNFGFIRPGAITRFKERQANVLAQERAKEDLLIQAVLTGKRDQAALIKYMSSEKPRDYQDELNMKISELKEKGLKVTQINNGPKSWQKILIVERAEK